MVSMFAGHAMQSRDMNRRKEMDVDELAKQQLRWFCNFCLITVALLRRILASLPRRNGDLEDRETPNFTVSHYL